MKRLHLFDARQPGLIMGKEGLEFVVTGKPAVKLGDVIVDFRHDPRANLTNDGQILRLNPKFGERLDDHIRHIMSCAHLPAARGNKTYRR